MVLKNLTTQSNKFRQISGLGFKIEPKFIIGSDWVGYFKIQNIKTNLKQKLMKYYVYNGSL